MSIMTLNTAHYKACAYSAKETISRPDFNAWRLKPVGLDDVAPGQIPRLMSEHFKNLYYLNLLAYYAKYESLKAFNEDLGGHMSEYDSDQFKTFLELPDLYNALSSIDYQIEIYTIEASPLNCELTLPLRESFKFLELFKECVAHEYIKNRGDSQKFHNIDPDKVSKVVNIFDL